MKLQHLVLNHNHLLVWCRASFCGQHQFILAMTDTSPAQWPEGFWAIPLTEPWSGDYVMLVEENISWLASPKHPKTAQ